MNVFSPLQFIKSVNINSNPALSINLKLIRTKTSSHSLHSLAKRTGIQKVEILKLWKAKTRIISTTTATTQFRHNFDNFNLIHQKQRQRMPIRIFQFQLRFWNQFCPCCKRTSTWNLTRWKSHLQQDLQLLHFRSISTGKNLFQDSDPSIAWKQSNTKFDNGPDQILPSEAEYTWVPDGAVKIKRNLDLNATETDSDPISIPSFLKRAVNRFPDSVAYGEKRDGSTTWKTITFEQYYQDVMTTAKGFIALGLDKHYSACILGMNSPEWFLSNFGAIFAGGISVGIYATNLPEPVAYCAADSRVNIFLVQDDHQFTKVEKIHDQLKHLRTIIQMEGEPRIRTFKNNPQIKILSWAELMRIGKEQSNQCLEERLRSIAVNQCSTLLYTSGTTGVPKGVMLSHDNLTWVPFAFTLGCKGMFTQNGKEKAVSFLPLSHSAAQFADLYGPVLIGAGMYFADKDAFKGTLINTLKEVQPTNFLTVPRFYEKLYEQLLLLRINSSGLRRQIVDFIKDKAYQHNMQLFQGNPNPQIAGFEFFDRIFFSKIKEQLGLNNTKTFFAGAAPLNRDILKYYMGLNIPICEVYGLTECTGPHTVHSIVNCRFGSVGVGIPGSKTKLMDFHDYGHGQKTGELIIKGRHIMMGYVGQPEKTMKVFTPDGYFKTGDVGYIDEDGFIFITGRDKDIIITAGGENVAPTSIEDRVKAHLPLVSNAVIIGEKQKCLTLLITIKTMPDPVTGEPTDILTPLAKTWIDKYAGMKVERVAQIVKEMEIGSEHKLRKAIQKRIDAVNDKSTSQAQLIRNWCVLPKDFSMAGGELGPTLKLKRNIVESKYEKVIAQLYQSAPK